MDTDQTFSGSEEVFQTLWMTLIIEGDHKLHKNVDHIRPIPQGD